MHRFAQRLEASASTRRRATSGRATSARTSGKWSIAIENGGNYGWSIREGFHAFQPQRRQRPDAAAKIQPPIVEYPHAPTAGRTDTGLSITGGFVYRGKKIPSLDGVYVYGDYETGRIWGLRTEKGELVADGELIDIKQSPKLNIASFGEDAEGELYILAFDEGRIHELVPRGK